jgi:hypothetical protein
VSGGVLPPIPDELEPEIVGEPRERDGMAICTFGRPPEGSGVVGIKVYSCPIVLRDGVPKQAGRMRLVYSRRIEPGEQLINVEFKKLAELQWAKAVWY